MTPRHAALALLATALFVPAAASAQDDSAWDTPVTADHPGFSDSSATIPARTYQVEVGLEGTKVAGGGPFNAGANLLGRFGLFDGLELRAEIPSVVASLDLEGRATTQLLFDTFEVGAKWSVMSGGAVSLSLIPTLIAPTTLGDSPLLIGGALGVVADIAISPGLGATLYAAPSFSVSDDGADGSATAFGATAAASLTLGLDRQLSVFFEGWAAIDAGGVSPAGDAGLIYLINPDMLVDVYFGVQLPGGQLTPYGGLGFSMRIQ